MTLKSTDDIVNSHPAVEQLRDGLYGILKQLAAEVHADVATLFLYDAEEDVFDLPVGYNLRNPDTILHPRLRPRTSRFAGRVVRQRRAVVVSKPAGHHLFDSAFARSEGIRSTAGFPLQFGDNMLGVTFVSYRTEHDFTRRERRRIAAWAARAAEAVQAAQIFPVLKRLRPRLSDLQRLADLVCTVHNLPAAIWVVDRRSQSVRIEGASGLTLSYLGASARLEDGSVIAQVVRTGRVIAVDDLQRDRRFRFPEQAAQAGWSSSLVYPIRVREEVLGVIEVFTMGPRRLGASLDDTFRHLAELAAAVLEKDEQEREARALAGITERLSNTLEFSQAMQIIVDGARDLLGTTSSTLFLFNKRTETFVVGARSPAARLERFPRPQGLSRLIVETGQTIRIGDTTQDSRVKPDVVREGSRAVLGVQVRMREDQIGVLWVSGDRVGQFSARDAELLENLANQVSVALGWARFLLKISDEIELATAELFKLPEVLKEVCETIRSALGFEFAAVQLIHPAERTIDTIIGSGIAGQWSGRARHSIDEVSEALIDIQADIVRTRHTEIIAGYDPRFDGWIFKAFHHEQFVRIFTPLLLVRNREGQIVNDWFDRCLWTRRDLETRPGDRRTILELTFDPDWAVEVIGTIEAGYRSRAAGISVEQARALAGLLAKRALDIHRCSLSAVLEAIADRAMHIVQADSASLHFQYDSRRKRYVYETSAGQIEPQFLREHPPRRVGLGQQAIQDGAPKVMSDPRQVEHFYPHLSQRGLRSLAAFPLLVDQQEGVLYIYFGRQHHCAEDEIRLVQLLAKRAVDAIRFATSYMQMREQARQLSILQSVTQSLGLERPETDIRLLRRVAWEVLHLVAADVVMLYEYRESDGKFMTPPAIAGRLQAVEAMASEIYASDVPAQLLAHGQNVYAPESMADSILNALGRQRPLEQLSFVMRERIVSSAGILLKVHDEVNARDEVVGVIFANYRRPHEFLPEEQSVVEALAASAAIAIKNQRLGQALKDKHRKLLHAGLASARAVIASERPEAHRVLETATQLTGAHYAALLERRAGGLQIEAVYPAGYEKALLPAAAGQVPLHSPGIIAQVARTGAPLFDNRATRPLADSHEAPRTPGSQLAVPMFQGAAGRGVLYVEHPNTDAFDQDDVEGLTVLAYWAAAAQKVEKAKYRMAARQALDMLGLLSATWAHRIYNQFNNIRVTAGNLRARHDQEQLRAIEEIAGEMAATVEWARWPASVDRESVDIGALLEQLIAECKQKSRYQPVAIRFTQDQQTPALVQANHLLLRQAFSILVDNAAEAMAEAPAKELTISLKCQPDQIEIFFRDSGRGIPPPLREFFGKRPLPSELVPQPHGWGIGAALVGLICEGYGGHLRVDDWGPGSTTVVMSFLPSPNDAGPAG